MSLRTKLVLSIFVFLVLVFGLLTLNLWLVAASRATAEAERDADLTGRVVRDLVQTWTSRFPSWSADAWAELSRKLELSELIAAWTVVGRGEGGLRVMISSELEPERIVRAEAALFAKAMDQIHVEPGGGRLYVPILTVQGDRFAARLDVRGTAVPGIPMAGALRGILAVMALGTILLLLNIVVLTNRLVLRPLDSLVAASNRVAAGDFSQKIPETATYDEMGRMIRAFNLMIDKTAEYQATLQKDIAAARGRITQTERRLFAAQRLSATGTLAAGIAHEINNPLGGMINAAHALREGRLDSAKQQEYLELILDGLERVSAIVQKILQFRPRDLEPRPVQLLESVAKAISFMEHRARAKEIGVRNELPADLPLVSGDPLELQQAFLNILMNAADACVMGEGMITIFGRVDGEAVRVSVADNGCGMEPDELARCTDLFYTTKDVGEGTGLGLAVAHNIVANCGGRLEIASERGRGTTVTLLFPLPTGRVPLAARAGGPEASVTPGGTG
ncbi:MAG TPA: HAMP domain-containing sensor histidine kinase [Planctomycetota bacterium]|nr:HAMP domain-containing sensor histidine kinase [Planctomycetota bacterium]